MRTIATGAAAGLAASFAMDRYQRATASLFGQRGRKGDPSTVRAARDAAALVGETVPDDCRRGASDLVHYVTGATMGIGYCAAVERWPRAAAGFGLGYGLLTSLVVDDIAVPTLGWGRWPWRSTIVANLFGTSAHLVFGAALEGARRAAVALPS